MSVSKTAKDAAKKAGSVLKNKAKLPGFGGAVFDYGANVVGSMMEGDSFGTSLFKAIPGSIAWAVAPGLMMTTSIASAIPGLVQGYMAADAKLASTYNMKHKPGTMFTYQDTNQAATMRQAAVQAIQGSKLNARNALGGEAALMHRNWSDRM
jgi:hypothetical protein